MSEVTDDNIIEGEIMDDEPYQLADTQFRYAPDVGEVAGPVVCGVCGQTTTVTRNCKGQTSMFSGIRDHDFFLCPSSLDDWHQQVVSIREEIKRTASDRLKAMLREEVCEILQREVG